MPGAASPDGRSRDVDGTDALSRGPDAARVPAPDPYGRAIREFHRGAQDEPPVDVDGRENRDHPIERFYVGSFDPAADTGAWLPAHPVGPLVDLAAGAGWRVADVRHHPPGGTSQYRSALEKR